MAHEDKEIKINRIEISRVENGFVYEVCVHAGDSMDRHEYVYEDVEAVVKAVRDDLESPHSRKDTTPEEKDEPVGATKTKQKSGKEKARKHLVAIAFSKAKGGLFSK